MSIHALLRRIKARFHSDYTTDELIAMGLVVGKNFLRMHNTIIDPSHCWLIHIGDNVTFAPRCHVLAHDASTFHALGYTKIGTVNIGNNVFIGAETVILPNVKIGDKVIIGANSTITNDIPSNSVAVGSPARVICTYDEYMTKNRELMTQNPVYGEEYTLRGGINEDKKIQMYKEIDGRIAFVK